MRRGKRVEKISEKKRYALYTTFQARCWENIYVSFALHETHALSLYEISQSLRMREWVELRVRGKIIFRAETRLLHHPFIKVFTSLRYKIMRRWPTSFFLDIKLQRMRIIRNFESLMCNASVSGECLKFKPGLCSSPVNWRWHLAILSDISRPRPI